MADAGEIARAAALIRAGRLVAFPTETVYGLGANALDAAAVDRIYHAKGRPATSPLIVHVGSVEAGRELCSSWPGEAEILAHAYWPGPLTLVVPKSPCIPDNVTAGLTTVGLRTPAHAVALALLHQAGVPIAAPSANRFTHVSPTTADHVRESLGSAVDLILDGGPCGVGIESTVLSLAEAGKPVLLRPGMVTREEIEERIGPVALAEPPNEGAHAAPGMHARHYSPRTPLRLGAPEPLERAAYIWWNRSLPCARTVQLPADAAAYATKLYSFLRQLDAEGWDVIVVEPPPTDPAWAGVADRLNRAATR